MYGSKKVYGSIKSVDICKCSDLVCCVEAVLLGYCWRLSCTAWLLLEAVLPGKCCAFLFFQDSLVSAELLGRAGRGGFYL